uniref:Protein-tyrosine-phosphatase n=1 Tax=Parastrongyloides trichosuri TaxID=131310 RepID=A0A0N4ZE70_PARTI
MFHGPEKGEQFTYVLPCKIVKGPSYFYVNKVYDISMGVGSRNAEVYIEKSGEGAFVKVDESKEQIKIEFSNFGIKRHEKMFRELFEVSVCMAEYSEMLGFITTNKCNKGPIIPWSRHLHWNVRIKCRVTKCPILFKINSTYIFGTGKTDDMKVSAKGEEYHKHYRLNKKIRTVLIILIIVNCLLIGIIIFVRVICMREKVISKIKAVAVPRIGRMYPNIIEWWKILILSDFVKYCQIVYDTEFILHEPSNNDDKQLTNAMKTKLAEEKVFNYAFCEMSKSKYNYSDAYYIQSITFKRSYILSACPTADDIEDYFEFIFENEVTNIVFLSHSKDSKTAKYYTPEKPKTYNNVTVEKIEEKVNLEIDLAVIKIKLTNKEGIRKKVCVYNIFNWGEINNNTSNNIFLYVYDSILKTIGSKVILSHSTRDIDAGPIIFTYLACTIDLMTTDTYITNPFDAIKKVKAQYYENIFGSREFAYLTRALVRYFYSEGILDDEEKEVELERDYLNYLRLLNQKNETNIFYNIIDMDSLNRMNSQLWTNYTVNVEKLKELCSEWFEVSKSQFAKNILRDIKYSCYDRNVFEYTDAKDTFKFQGFLNGNYFDYRLSYNSNVMRSTVMCQLTTASLKYPMIAKIYTENILTIVILSNGKELTDSFDAYFPLAIGSMELKNYTIKTDTITKDYIQNTDLYDVSIVLKDKQKNVINVKILHYKEWPERGVPKNPIDIIKLYEEVLKFEKTKTILVHSRCGVGRAGTFVSIMYILDMMRFKKRFAPIKHVEQVRNYRYGAVETRPQFIFILIVFCNYFKDKIEEIHPGGFYRYMRYFQIYSTLED